MSKKLIEGLDYYVRVIPFPTNAVEGFILPDVNGATNIYINANLCPRKRLEALNHELRHIQRDDLYNDIDSVKDMEASI